MANILEGFLIMKSDSEALLDDLTSKVETGLFKVFYCGGPANRDVLGKKEGELTKGFTGRWNCSFAWSFFNKPITDVDYAYADKLVRAEIIGTDREDGVGYFIEANKAPGKREIDRMPQVRIIK